MTKPDDKPTHPQHPQHPTVPPGPPDNVPGKHHAPPKPPGHRPVGQ